MRGISSLRCGFRKLAALAVVAGLLGCTADPYLARTPAPQTNAREDQRKRVDRPQRQPRKAPEASGPRLADKVVVLKHRRRLFLIDDGEAFRSFEVALGFTPRGPKRREGDGRTPEGRYVLDWRNPDSRFYRSIHISYPSPADTHRARQAGMDPGDNIMIHGLPEKFAWMGRNHTVKDWTDGCIAVTNKEMDVIWARVPPGTPIEIRP